MPFERQEVNISNTGEVRVLHFSTDHSRLSLLRYRSYPNSRNNPDTNLYICRKGSGTSH